jgi:hypothetical protein
MDNHPTRQFPPDEYLSAEEVQTLYEVLQGQLAEILDESRESVQHLTEVRRSAGPSHVRIT